MRLFKFKRQFGCRQLFQFNHILKLVANYIPVPQFEAVYFITTDLFWLCGLSKQNVLVD